MAQRAKILIVSAAALLMTAPVAFADTDQQDTMNDTETTESNVQNSPDMSGMADMMKMGGGQMKMMQAMMRMHMSMMGGTQGMGMGMGMGMMGGGKVAKLFSDGSDPAEILSRYDTNGDGSIDLSEFEAWNADAHRSQMVDRFQELDADGMGGVSAEEIAAAAKARKQHKNAGMMKGGKQGKKGH